MRINRLLVTLVAISIAGCGNDIEKNCGEPPIVADQTKATKVEGALEGGLLKKGLSLSGEFQSDLQRSAVSIFRGEGDSAQEGLKRLAMFQYCAAVYSDKDLSGEERLRLLQQGYNSIQAAYSLVKEEAARREREAREQELKRQQAACIAEKIESINSRPLEDRETSAVRVRCQNHGDGETSWLVFDPGQGFELVGTPRAVRIAASDGGVRTVTLVNDDPSGRTIAKAEVWCQSSKQPFGSGAWAEYKLEGKVRRVVTSEDRHNFESECAAL